MSALSVSSTPALYGKNLPPERPHKVTILGNKIMWETKDKKGQGEHSFQDEKLNSAWEAFVRIMTV